MGGNVERCKRREKADIFLPLHFHHSIPSHTWVSFCFFPLSLLPASNVPPKSVGEDVADGEEGDVDGSRSRVMEAVSAPGSFTIGFAFSFLSFLSIFRRMLSRQTTAAPPPPPPFLRRYYIHTRFKNFPSGLVNLLRTEKFSPTLRPISAACEWR